MSKVQQKSSNFWFTQVDAVVLRDAELSLTTRGIYAIICSYASTESRSCWPTVETLAKDAGVSERTIQRALKELVGKGLITRRERFVEQRQISSVIFIVGFRAARYDASGTSTTAGGTPTTSDGNICGGTHTAGGYDTSDTRGATPAAHRTRSKNNIKDSLKGGDGLPRNEKEPIKATSVTSPSQPIASNRPIPNRSLREIYTPDDAPVVLKQTAKYFLHETGRAGLTSDDISALMALNANHSPARIQKEIDTACDRFRRRGQVLTALTFAYIAGSLEHQQSLPKRKGSRSGTVVLGMSQADIDRCSQVKPLTPEEIESFKKQLEADIREGRIL